MAYDTKSIGISTDEVKPFTKPIMMLTLMFFGMVPAIFFWCIQQYFTAPEKKDKVPFKTFVILIIPSVCDLLCTLLLLIAQLYITASLWQMMRGSIIIITALMKRFALNHRLKFHMWLGVGFITLGTYTITYNYHQNRHHYHHHQQHHHYHHQHHHRSRHHVLFIIIISNTIIIIISIIIDHATIYYSSSVTPFPNHLLQLKSHCSCSLSIHIIITLPPLYHLIYSYTYIYTHTYLSPSTVAMLLVASTSFFSPIPDGSNAAPGIEGKDPRIGILLVFVGCLAQGVQCK